MSTKNLQILDSLIPSYDENLSETSTNAVQNKAVASAVSDLNTRVDDSVKVISSTYETKSDASSKLTEAKTYTDTVASGKSDVTHTHDEDYDALGAANTALASAKSYTDTKTSSLASTSSVDSKMSTHNTSTSAHNDIRALITDLTTKLNNFLDVDDTTVDQLSEVLTLIDNNKGTLESLTTSKINVSDIVDNLTTSSASKVLSAAQGAVIQSLIDALQTELDALETVVAGKAAGSHTHTIANITDLQASLDAKANSADIAKTSYIGISNSAAVYVKVSDFGAWGTGAWYQKGFSMLLTSRAGELVWVSLAANDSNTTAKAFRLINTYSKITNIYYSASESAIYAKMVAWCNNLCAHIITNVNGDYVPTVAQASALPDDAVEINIVEFGVSSNGTQVGDTSVNLLLGGAATRPTYNGNDVALKSDVDAVTLDTLGGNDRYYTEAEIDSKVSTLNSAISGKASITTANVYNGEQKFQNSHYCLTAQDNASGVGVAYKASRGAVNQEIVGQIIMPYTACTDSYGCDNTVNQIKFQKITGTNDGIPSLSTVATLTDSYLQVPALKLGTASYGTTDLTAGSSSLATGKLYIVYE